MKKKILIIITIIIAIIIIGIGYFIVQDFKQEEKLKNELEETSNIVNVENNNNNTVNKSFGSYEVPENWVESKEHSTNSKFFYVLEGQEQEAQPNNISINSGTNKYAETEHEKFKTAILNQLSMQIAGKEDIEIKANGSDTNNGYIVYTFIIKETTDNITTTQYYIVGDYKYILIHETVFGESEETDDVAKSIVDSFKWKD
ncbi:MAG: hypothetical protein IJE05_03195 [Clostridia bacterium]|nr:hypothetical protein [Clostridia bacterium]